ncbi:NUDIX domain-containing protein [soil metagenome]
MSGPAEEIADLVDEDDVVVGQATRAEIRARNLRHRGVGVLVRNKVGAVYVHRRTESKDVFPGLFDMFVGGMVGAGESYEEAARRELAEELGITGVALRFLVKDLYTGAANNCFSEVYEVAWDGDVTPQRSEIAWGEWVDEAELARRLDEREFVPDGLQIYRRLFGAGS